MSAQHLSDTSRWKIARTASYTLCQGRAEVAECGVLSGEQLQAALYSLGL
jgi:hypothetical protein